VLLKRLYDHSGKEPKVSGVNILRHGKTQKFSPRLVQGGLSEGWLEITGDTITINGKNKKLVYRIDTNPGYYCCFCNASVGDSSGATVHLSKEHKGKKSPDKSNPSGYRKDNFYACTKTGGK
jgi:hypothetical protein